MNWQELLAQQGQIRFDAMSNATETYFVVTAEIDITTDDEPRVYFRIPETVSLSEGAILTLDRADLMALADMLTYLKDNA